jgi:hypothetical protein
MFNKESCRRCGSLLESIKTCADCKEIMLWQCNKCNNREEHTHLHKYKNINGLNQTATIEIKANK